MITKDPSKAYYSVRITTIHICDKIENAVDLAKTVEKTHGDLNLKNQNIEIYRMFNNCNGVSEDLIYCSDEG
jgi:hypothetical protein